MEERESIKTVFANSQKRELGLEEQSRISQCIYMLVRPNDITLGSYGAGWPWKGQFEEIFCDEDNMTPPQNSMIVKFNTLIGKDLDELTDTALRLMKGLRVLIERDGVLKNKDYEN